jgi:glutamate racemase
MTAPARLGIFDWGIGGVGVLCELRRRAKHVPVLYVSDSGYIPYGLLSRAALAARVSRILGYMVERGATSIVVACNAASTVLGLVEPPVPCVGVIEPALALVPPAFRGTLAVIGGARTIRSGIYQRGLERRGRTIVQRIAQPLSAHIEAGTTESARCAADLARILKPLRAADALLLACTHYPAIAARIAARLPNARLIDPAAAVVEHALATFPLPRTRAPDSLLTTGDARRSRAAAQRAWGFDAGPWAFARI